MAAEGSLPEKRDIKRKKKRLKVRFGVDAPKRVAFTEDISDRGVFIITGQPERPGTLIVIDMLLPDETRVLVYGRVRWAKKVPPRLVRVANKGGMGVVLQRFEKGEQEYRALVEGLRH